MARTTQVRRRSTQSEELRKERERCEVLFIKFHTRSQRPLTKRDAATEARLLAQLRAASQREYEYFFPRKERERCEVLFIKFHTRSQRPLTKREYEYFRVETVEAASPTPARGTKRPRTIPAETQVITAPVDATR